MRDFGCVGFEVTSSVSRDRSPGVDRAFSALTTNKGEAEIDRLCDRAEAILARRGSGGKALGKE